MNYQSTQNWMRAPIAIAMVIGLSFAACGKKDDGGGQAAAVPAPPPAPINQFGTPTCGGCPGNMGFLVSALAQSNAVSTGQNPIMEIGLDFFGDAGIINQLRTGSTTIGAQPNYFNALPATPYQGPAAAGGYMYLSQAVPNCGLPAGSYSITTQTLGVWGNDGAGRSFDNFMLTASGPAQAQIYISGYTVPATPPPIGVASARMYPYRFSPTSLQIKRMDSWSVCNLSGSLQ